MIQRLNAKRQHACANPPARLDPGKLFPQRLQTV